MGARGTRPTTVNKTEYEEPMLLKGLDDLLAQAADNSCYDGDKLDMGKLVEHVSISNPNDPLRLEYTTMEPTVSGSLTFENGVWTIKINKSHNVKRQRFTVAHELGHYMMHRNKSATFTDNIFFRAESKEGIEYRANEFASKLLMPADKVRSAIKEGERNLGALAERFGVSSPAMKLRVQELGYRLRQNE